jgi:hypothetical protein
VPAIVLDYGVGDPLVIEPGSGALVHAFRGPTGVSGSGATALVERSLREGVVGPPLTAHVVADDRVVVAVSGDVPQDAPVLAAIREVLGDAATAPALVSVVRGTPLAPDRPALPQGALPPPGAVDEEWFDPAAESSTSYLGAGSAGRPRYLARALVDADVVLTVGGWDWNAAFGGPSIEGDIWPVFSRSDARRDLFSALARRGRRALPAWRATSREIAWQLGVTASLRLVAGRAGTLHAACFGLPTDAEREARAAATGWRPRLSEAVDLTIASLTDPAAGFDAVTRAVAAAARVTRPGGTICIASRVAQGPGIVFLRWRQGAPLPALLREAVASGDPVLVADALAARLFARALGPRRIVLLSAIDESTVEELGFGHAAAPEVVERLAHRAASVAVLEEADRMLPDVAR